MSALAIFLPLLYLWLFWYAYIVVMGLYRAHLDGRLPRVGYVLGAPALAVGYLMDVLAQYTIASLVFLDLPRRGEWLVTSRLQRYIAHDTGWRAAKARWICDNLLDVFDPSGDHC